MCSLAGSFIKLFLVVTCTLEEKERGFSFSCSKKPLCFMCGFLGLGRASEGFHCRRRHSSWEAAQRQSLRSFPKERANSQSYNCRKGSGQNSPPKPR